MKKILPALLAVMLCAPCYALAPEHLTEYDYEVRCTCGLLFSTEKTNNKTLSGRISHTMCYDCMIKIYGGYELFDTQKFQEILENMRIKTMLARSV